MQIRSALFLLPLLSTACAGDSPASTPPRVEPDLATGISTWSLESAVEAALDDAARRMKLDRLRLEVMSKEYVTWTDGSLGCPQPDVMYTQALVPGYRIRIRAGAEVLDYHGGKRGPPVLCPPSRSVEPAVGGPT